MSIWGKQSNVALLGGTLALLGFVELPQAYGLQEAEDKTAEISQADKILESLEPAARQAVDSLKQTLPEDSEARAMLDTILEGKRMGPEDGWFALAKPESLYDWSSMLERYDSDQDQVISKNEFQGPDKDFQVMDRNGDGWWTESDWDWAKDRGSDTFSYLASRADANDDGQISPDELKQFAEDFAKRGEESVSLETFRSWVEPPRRHHPEPPQRPTPSQLVMGLQHQEIGSHQPGPGAGETAPDFELKSLDGQVHSLKESLQSRPTVLIFGNFTCGPYRSQSANVRELIERYRDRVNFLMIYVREAHPADGWIMSRNERQGIEIFQPKSYDQRKQVAEQCARHFDAGVPMLVDSLEDPVGKVYSGMPSRLYLINQQQEVIYQSGRGPHFFWPSDLENALVAFLNDPAYSQP